MNYGDGDLKKGMISMLRAAYLWGFYELGYSFILNKSLNMIRAQILEPQKDLYSSRFVIKGNLPSNFCGINLVTQPNDSEVYLVIMNLKFGNLNDLVGVILPGSHEGGMKQVESFRNTAHQEFKLELLSINDLEILHDPKHCILPSMYWFEKYSVPE